MVDEHIFCAAIRGDKAEALLAVEPFHISLCHTNISFFSKWMQLDASTVTVARTNQQNRHRSKLPAAFGPAGVLHSLCPDDLVRLGFGRRTITPDSSQGLASALLGVQQSLGLRDLGGLGALRGTFLFQGLTRLFGHSLPGGFVRHRGPLILGGLSRSRFLQCTPLRLASGHLCPKRPPPRSSKKTGKKTIRLLPHPELARANFGLTRPAGGPVLRGVRRGGRLRFGCAEIMQHKRFRSHEPTKCSSLRDHARPGFSPSVAGP